MSYSTDKNKLRKIYNKVEETKNMLDVVAPLSINITDSTFFNNKYAYETDWKLIENYPYSESIKLQFPDISIDLLPFFNIIVVFKTEDGFTDRLADIENDPDFYWIYYDFNYSWELQESPEGNSTVICHIDTSGFFGDFTGYNNEDNVSLPLYYKVILSTQNFRYKDELRTNKK